MSNPEAILSSLEMFGVRLGLERTRDLLAHLGDPHERVSTVLVAGSNGKGSTAALLSSIVGAAGYGVGLFTSPHLETVEERVRVSGRSIEPSELGDLLDIVIDAGRVADQELPTYFEALTIAALLYFERRSVDLAVLEVGLGGRLDATNVTEPLVSLITSISLDHQKVLGETLQEIAFEKAGILRPGVPAAMWVDEGRARSAVQDRAAELDTPIIDARASTSWKTSSVESELILETDASRYRLCLPLEGSFQRRNAGLAVIGAELISSAGWEKIDRAAIELGIAECRWPGRMETVEISEERSVLLDSAHNQESIVLLRQHVEALSKSGCRFNVLFGALRDKAAAGMLQTISEGAQSVVVVAPQSDRAIAAEELAGFASGAIAEVSCQRALDRALALDCDLTLVCGSIYLVGEVRTELRRRYGVPALAATVPIGR